MGVFIDILFLGIAFIALAVSGGYATSAATKVGNIPNYSSNPDLDSAHRYLSIAAVVTWITVAAILVLGIVYLIFGSEEATVAGEATGFSFTNLVIYGLLFLALVATIVVGILSAIAAQKIANSKVSNDNGSRHQAIVAAILALVAGAGLLIGLIVMFVRPKKKKEDKSSELEKEIALLA